MTLSPHPQAKHNYVIPLNSTLGYKGFTHIPKPTERDKLIQAAQHRIGGPAIEVYNREGVKIGEEWYLNNALGRADNTLPSLSYSQGKHLQEWHNAKGLHRKDGPALILEDGTEQWWRNGMLHRKNAPAIISPQSEEWYWKGKRHNPNGPAVKHVNGNEEWWHKGLRHNWNGPALNTSKVFVVGAENTQKNKPLTFYLQWKVFGIPTRHPHICEEITNKTHPPTTERLYELLEHEDYVVAMLAHHHLPIPFKDKPSHTFYDDDNFFNLFTEHFLKGENFFNLVDEAFEYDHELIWLGRALFREKVTFPIVVPEETYTLPSGRTITQPARRVWQKEGIYHRDPADGPAHEMENEQQYWYKGERHNPHSPAVLRTNSYGENETEWWYKNQLHNLNGPAVESWDGTEWYTNGVPHNPDGPAIVHGSYEEWWLEGKRHNLKGKAVEHVESEEVQWWVNNYTTYEPELCEEIFKPHTPITRLIELAHHEDYVVRNLAQYQHNVRAGHCEPESFFNWESSGEEKITEVHTLFGKHKAPFRLHNSEGPAIIHPNGNKEWWFMDELSRNGEDLPTVVCADGTQYWWKSEREYQKRQSAILNPSVELHRTTGPAIIYPPNVKKTPAHRFVWWWEGETTNENELCEQAVNPHTNPDTLYDLCFHEDVVVRNLALYNPNCPPEGKVEHTLEALNAADSERFHP